MPDRFVRVSDHFTSTFLRPFAPPALPGFLTTMDALTPERPALRRPRPSPLSRSGDLRSPFIAEASVVPHEHLPCIRSGLPALRDRPSEHSAPKHLTAPCRRFHTQPLSATGFGLPDRHRSSSVHLDFATDLQARRSAPPNRVRYPTDCSFTSSCSSPLLAETQLLSVTGRSVYAWRGLSPLRTITLAGAQVRGLAAPFPPKNRT